MIPKSQADAVAPVRGSLQDYVLSEVEVQTSNPQKLGFLPGESLSAHDGIRRLGLNSWGGGAHGDALLQPPVSALLLALPW